ncbi:MAG TPA: archaeosine biosynthesis radical SAM protein RaSEA [Methanoregulaceae archaeon]|nr:archaeosine biosynthesis radical SAM protein RaSEA [Methanoregulaceae archaeon]
MVAYHEDKPLACFPGTDRYENRQLKSLTIILRTAGCSWNRCLMCSYRHERFSPGSPELLADSIIRQLRYVAANFSLPEIEMVKLYSSGSFFDPDEVPPEVLHEAASLFRGKLVVAETRPEYINAERLGEFISMIDTGRFHIPLYTAIGVETSDDTIREKSISKGFSFGEFQDAASVARKAGAGVKAYLLMKPLFLTEKESIQDMKHSIADLDRHADMISMNPCNVQRRTDMEWFWKQGAYRPPYLWSVADILVSVPRDLLCDPVGGGHQRGPHNCGECDHGIIAAIRNYTLTGEREHLKSLIETGCECRAEWEFILETEMSWCMPLTR